MFTVAASEFKAKCLDILDRVASGELDGVTITKRGRVVGLLYPPARAGWSPDDLFGAMRGTVAVPADVDLTAPTCPEQFSAASGRLHE